ncbi:MAG: type II toxin-antitoxin system HicB family antitoxin [Dehalococcoidia bacterium]|nr:type II toxin-antitoxin system HicB family antitoxin [Dehalococcoidia bacterium]MYA51981.1 type II toxin-antitoxin system HicB family antitoxin [Dehalococcoidia bacterium]MYH68388.1 type II toxin-antitoxin system HicB family antitoxin [Dehalococcoidia bacterium]
MTTFTAYVEWDEEVNLFVGTVPGIRGAHTQAATLDELRDNLREVLELLAEEGELSADEVPQFVGLQQLDVAV